MLPPPEMDVHLASGMRLVVHVMETRQVVLQTRVAVGAAHESEDQRGAAHVVEHMLFTGAGGVTDGAYDRYVRGAGGTDNAYTFQDRTEYDVTTPALSLPGLLQLEGGRFSPHTFDPALLDREVRVTTEEQLMRAEGNQSVAHMFDYFEQLLPGHPYGRSVSPRAEINRALTASRVQAFFDAWYTPDRFTLVVAGNVVPSTVRTEVERVFPHAGAPPRADPFPTVVDWTRPRRVDGAEVGTGLMWPMPPETDPDAAALHWIAAIAGPSHHAYQWAQGGVWVMRVPDRSMIDSVEQVVANHAPDWITQERLDAALANERLPWGLWSASAWVRAWDRSYPPPVESDCRATWNRRIRHVEPTQLAAGG